MKPLIKNSQSKKFNAKKLTPLSHKDWRTQCPLRCLWIYCGDFSHSPLVKSLEHQQVRKTKNVSANMPEHLLLLCKCVSVCESLSFLLTCMLLSACSPLLCVCVCTSSNQHNEESYVLFSTCRKENNDFHSVVFASCATACALYKVIFPNSLQQGEQISSRKPPVVICLCKQQLWKKTGPDCPHILISDVHV